MKWLEEEFTSFRLVKQWNIVCNSLALKKIPFFPCHLEFVVSLTWRVCCVIQEYFPLFMGKCIPDAYSLSIDIPGSFSLVSRAASSPGETCRGTKNNQQIVYNLILFLFCIHSRAYNHDHIMVFQVKVEFYIYV